MKLNRYFFYTAFLFLHVSIAFAQPPAKKYPSLLWEITGNGLTKPSYLFGTMHVSSKVAFHLSDSFYHALKRVDAVALELNPDLWQSQMVRLTTLNDNYQAFVQSAANEYLKESSFKLASYDDVLKMAMSTEPPVVNSLLYRSYKTRDDFEEDTFLDLYIFQAGRKLGKAPAGVEDYYESEKLVMEAYRDMALEKDKKEVELDGETMASMLQKLQQAYRYGDLDMMDSLDNVLEKSKAFREKFLYKRNEIQANSIDSIIKTRSLFAGVGAAHLPGDRGVIELLRKMGYTMRPVKMTDRDAEQKAAIDKMKVPVSFSRQTAEDGFYAVDVPGPLYSLQSSYQALDRSQFADMNNGSYYMVTRVRTYASFFDKDPSVYQKVDSLLYEYIPGTIVKKEQISRNGYPGYNITNRTRRGDLQRYNIFVTPYEVLLFKMSGKKDYVDGEEAEKFFSSITLKEFDNTAKPFVPAQGGFSVEFPHEPHQYYNPQEDGRWEYEAIDKTTGNAYLLLKRPVYNYSFLTSDSFDLAMIEQSFRSSELFDKQLERKYTQIDGYPALLVKEKLKNGSIVHAAYIVQGPHYYVLAQRTKTAGDKNFKFYRSLHFVPYVYEDARLYSDSFLLVKTKTPVAPELDNSIRSIIEKSMDDAANGNNANGYITYWKNSRNGIFASKRTGEMISVRVQEYPKYYYIRDSAKYWQGQIDDYLGDGDMIMSEQHWFTHAGGAAGVQFVVKDTGSSRQVQHMILLSGKYQYTVSALTDTLERQSSFIKNVFESFAAHEKVQQQNLYENKLALFFTDLFSTDSAVHKRAQQAIANIYFGSKGAASLYEAISRLSMNDKNYFESKSKLISELGYIKDSVPDEIPMCLKKIYEQTADTSLFQNEAVMALARLKTKGAYAALKDIITQDPPVFETDDEYDDFFEAMEDSLALSKTMFPELLQFTSLNDYKDHVIDLLLLLVDSGYLKAADYQAYLPGIYVDAKVAWKKQQAREEKIMEQNNKKASDNDEEDDDDNYYTDMRNSYDLRSYAALLMPFYETNKNVPAFFARLLQSKNDVVRRNALVLMLRHNKDVPDSILQQLAASDKERGALFSDLEKAGRLDKFPLKYKTQIDLARSYMIMDNLRTRVDSVLFIKKIQATVLQKTGYVYCFKYREKKSADWKIGFSGLQPLAPKEVNSSELLAEQTDKKINNIEPLDDQLQKELRRYIFPKYASGRNFFSRQNNYEYSGVEDDY